MPEPENKHVAHSRNLVNCNFESFGVGYEIEVLGSFPCSHCEDTLSYRWSCLKIKPFHIGTHAWNSQENLPSCGLLSLANQRTDYFVLVNHSWSQNSSLLVPWYPLLEQLGKKGHHQRQAICLEDKFPLEDGRWQLVKEKYCMKVYAAHLFILHISFALYFWVRIALNQ